MKAISINHFIKLLQFLSEKHHPVFSNPKPTRRIKYILPSMDMRDNTVFAIALVGYGWKKTFVAGADPNGLSNPLDSEVRKYLLEGECNE